MQVLKYPPRANGNTESNRQRRVHQLLALAKTLAKEVETLRSELTVNRFVERDRPLDPDVDGIDFYGEIRRYEIELIRNALGQCDGNQSQAARLLHMKSTTLNAKMKHYGINSGRVYSTRPN